MAGVTPCAPRLLPESASREVFMVLVAEASWP